MKFIRKILASGSLALIFSPSIAFAALGGTYGLITSIRGFIDLLIVIMAGLALLVFFWGLVKFISKAGDAKAVDEGKTLMIWGVIALFVMISVWGIIRFIQGELLPGEDFTTPPKIPSF